jgi:hypothetical protein
LGILDGQPVNQAYTNPAFLDRRADDTAVGKYTLNNTDPVSGSSVTNVQREHNSVASFVGKSLNSVKDDLPAWTNTQVGSSSDTLKTRADLLTQRFSGSTGHSHNGTDGQGPNIVASTLASVPYRGYVLQGTTLTSVTGLSTNVSTQLSGSTPGGSASVLGVVTSAPYNKIILRQATGSNAGDSFVDTLGNVVYGRLTYASSVWTLSYYVLLSAIETTYSFGSSVNVDWYYQQIYNPMISVPTYSEFAVIPSDNVTADVLSATQSVQGKVLLSSAVGAAVGTTGSVGTANATVANADHVHAGVHSISKSGSTALLGDVTITGSNAVAITQVGQNIDISSQGSIGYQETPAGIRNGINTTFGPLTYTPSSAASVLVFLDYVALPNTSWSLVGSSIVFSSDIPQFGQSVYVFYMYAGTPNTPPVPTGAFNLEYRTLSSGEISAKSLTLNYAPAVANLTVVDLVGSTAQIFNVDFTIAGSSLTWNGLALDGILSAGDILRVQYFT